jgi:hypothetical protein
MPRDHGLDRAPSLACCRIHRSSLHDRDVPIFTSSYAGSRYYYDRRTCSQWKSLSRTYLQGFNTKAALLAKYNRRLHPPC